jgi:hypothetical protein
LYSSTNSRPASRSAFLMLLIAEICEPRWKCISLSVSIWPQALSLATASTISAAVRPNFEKSPPDCSQRPAPRDDRRAHAEVGVIFTRSATR